MNRFSGIVLRIVFMLWPFIRVRAHHAEWVPNEGPSVIIAKHQRYLDIAILTAISKKEIRYMAKKSLFKFPLFGWYIRSTGSFPVEQHSPDRAALKTAAQKLADNETLGIFAEGTRTKGNTVGEIQPGLILAIRTSETNCPLIPCGICYTYKGLVLYVNVCFGKPFRLEECGAKKEEILESIRERMQDMQNQACNASL